MGVGILISSYHCTWEFWYLLTIVHTQGQFEVPRGWKFWYLLTIVHTQGQFEVPWGWEFLYLLTIVHTQRCIWSSTGGIFDIFLPLYTLKGEFEVLWGWEFWYLPTIVHSKVNVKFHGGGNFDVFLITIAPTQRSIWRSMKVETLVSSCRCTNWRSIWSFMGVGILISSYHCTLKGQFEVPWGWEIWYLLTVYTLNVNLKCHGGGNFYIFLPLYALKGVSEVPRGGILDIFLPLYTFKVNLKFHGGGIWISSYPCTHSRSIWNSMGVGFGYLLTLVHIQGQFEVHGVSQGSACDHREGVRSCAIRRPALHKRSCTIREVAYLQSGWYRIAVGHTMNSKGARSSVNVECDVVRAK